MKTIAILGLALAGAVNATKCPEYEAYASKKHKPFSSGDHHLPFQRPKEECRTYKVASAERTITHKAKDMIKDPDLYRLFENAWVNTLDTTVKWTGYSADDDEEELAFVTTGDINAMWLRDSANQLQSYKSILPRGTNCDSKNKIGSLYRGVINLQGRYLRQDPYCNAYQPPVESGIAPENSTQKDTVTPEYDPNVVFECKYELDSLAAFLQLSWDYYDASGDADFFGAFSWVDTVTKIMDVAKGLQEGTYAEDGTINKSPYTWHRESNSATETVSNNGNGEPVIGGIGLIRSFFRPSDDSTTFQYLIPSNMMFQRYLKACAKIMKKIDAEKAKEMEEMAAEIKQGIEEHSVVQHPKFGKVYAFEIDGFGSFNLMDDANLPSLLSIPHLGYEPTSTEVYQNTRDFVLSKYNRYYAFGPVLSAIGGPHLGPGNGWPMAVIMQTMTSDDDEEIVGGIKQILGATSGLGLIHESVNSQNSSQWTRPWFSWANGLFGQMILDLVDRKPELVSKSYQ